MMRCNFYYVEQHRAALYSIGSISALAIYLFERDSLIIVFPGAFVFGHIQSSIQRVAIYTFGSHKIKI